MPIFVLHHSDRERRERDAPLAGYPAGTPASWRIHLCRDSAEVQSIGIDPDRPLPANISPASSQPGLVPRLASPLRKQAAPVCPRGLLQARLLLPMISGVQAAHR